MRRIPLIVGLVLASWAMIGCDQIPVGLDEEDPGYTRQEASRMLGRRVRCVYGTDEDYAAMNSPDGEFKSIYKGAQGTISEIEEVSPAKYFVVVHWEPEGAAVPWTTSYGPLIYEKHLSKYLVIEEGTTQKE